MKKTSLFLALILCTCLIASYADDDKTTQDDPITIAFLQGYNPHSGYTLSGNFSKMKQYLQNEFNATVKGISNLSYSNLQDVDILIMTVFWQSNIPTSHLNDLRNWIQDGGSFLYLLYPMDNFLGDGSWDELGGRWIGGNIMDPNGFNWKQMVAGSHDGASFAAPFGSTPYSISHVDGSGSAGTALPGRATGGSKFIVWNGNGDPIAVYQPDAWDGKIVALGNHYWFQNNLIDNDDNKHFLYNIITELGGTSDGDDGGGGNGSSDFFVKKAKGKPRVVAPGNKLKLVGVVKNKSNQATTPTILEMYLSLDLTLDGGDLKMAQGSLPSLGPGQKKKLKIFINLPNIAADYYYVIAEIKSNGDYKASKKQIEVR
jgi:hypothetical protein